MISAFLNMNSNFPHSRKKFEKALKKDLLYDDSKVVSSKIISSEEIVYLLDNSGEALLDKLLLEKIKDSGKEITIAARSGPIQDDITVKMAQDLTFMEIGNLIPGGRVTGFDPVEGLKEFRNKLGVC